MAKPKPEARYVVFRCFDKDDSGSEYYESLDLVQAAHPQTMLALDLNDKPIDADHGAPVRLRIPTQLGYKSAKWVGRIEVADSFKNVGSGKGGYWEDQGYDWYAGI
jgi:DMSO/TMAO reductase YedYZ molybdopterin-dependent catalytic subunit